MNALAIHLYLSIRYINLSFNYFGNFYRIIVNEGIKHETLRLLSDCNRYGKCGIAISIEEADKYAQEAMKYSRMSSQQIKDYFISLTHIDYEKESL